ncbi:non-ribosomal peptide synthetase [Streptomyces sp. Caat 7-52]|uniref:non-ribosomal peptide synthetase n=1 Tax=Streptomyces sp. Caat 7-52 TaxID=2949637 RepID=UPI002035251F|nr:non-ribosomal peptide synthetase [Streptomyces sp. Caat 7-52]
MTAPVRQGARPAASLADRFSALGGEQRVKLLRKLVESGRVRDVPAVVPPRDPARPVRLSPAQQDLWAYESLYPGTPALNLCCAYHFDDPVDTAHLEAALTLVQEHHDILRTRITEGPGGEPHVDFPDAGPFVLEHDDLRGTGTTVHQAFDAFRRRPFDLDGGRLIRGRFVRVDDRRTTLMLSVHHAIADWWSFDVLQTEFAEAYLAVREGTEPRSTRPAIQYADFSAWQGELEEAGVFGERLAFWRRYLADPPGPLTAPGYGSAADDPDRDPDAVVHIGFDLDPPTAAAVRALARRSGTTVYGVLMAAFAVLAHRVTGAEDMVLGTPVANRSAKGLERVIGYVMNAVPTRWRVRPDSSFADLVAVFAADFPDLVANADLPVGRIVAAAAPERSIGRSPLFQWVFMHLTQQPSVSAVREFAEPERIHTGGEHDLVGVVKDSGDAMIGSFEIRTDTFSPAAVQRWAECYVELLKQVTADPALRVGDIGIVPPGLRERLLGLASGSGAVEPVSLPGLVARHAARTPDAPALDTGARTWSYGQLADRVDRLAGALARRGAGPGSIVAVLRGRGTDWPVTALAVQRTGAAYLPLDPEYPAERLRRTLADAGPVLVVADDAVPAAGDVPVLVLGPEAYEGEPLTGPCPDPSGPAYVIHTSGSTGTPKGVVVPHSGLAALAESLAGGLGLGPGDRVLQLGPPTFDISVADLCMAFGSGATLVLPPAGLLVGEDLGRVLTHRRVSAVMTTPSVLATVPAGAYPDLRVLAVGAEVCPPELVERWATDGRRFHNVYGPTEATVAVTLSEPLARGQARPPLGRPLAGTHVRLLDGRLRPAAPGTQGELYLAGPLAHGYLHSPGQTAARFTADPYGPPGSRMYRTGDLAWQDDDGTFHYLGRTDDQVKLRGLRAEPAEIAAVLAEHPAVGRSVALVREGGTGRPQLVGYVVPAPGHRPDPDALLTHAAERLPAGLVPADVVVLDAFPLTANGKIDKAALPSPAPRGPVASAAPARALSPAEQTLCALYSEVLGTGPAGVEVDADFFRLGGDSIMAIQLAARAAAAGLLLAPRDVFTARTPARLALSARPATPEQPAGPDVAEGRLPLTPIMHWWREQGSPLGTFIQSMAFPVPHGVGLDRIRAAVTALAERHAALRMRLIRHDDSADWELEAGPAAVRTERIAVPAGTLPDGLAEESARSAVLDPEQGEMLRAVWFDAGPDRPGLLLLLVHHLAVDGVSWRVLGQELARLLADGGEPTTDPGASFARWARLLPAEAERAVGELDWWTDQLTDAGKARLTDGPDDWTSGSASAPRRAAVTVELDAGLTRDVLVTLPGAFHCGTDAVLLTALVRAAVRRRGTGTGLLLHLEGHGREALSAPVDVSRTVGWFVTQYPVRLDPGEDTGAAALKRVKEQLRAVPSAGLGWGLLRYLHPGAGPVLAGLPAPDVRFAYLGRFAGDDAAGGRLLDSGPEAVPVAHALEIDVLARGAEGEPRLEATFSYAEGVLTGDDVRELARLWTEELTALVAATADGSAAGHTPSDFPLVDLTVDQLMEYEDDLEFEDDGDDFDGLDHLDGSDRGDGLDGLDGLDGSDRLDGLDRTDGLDGLDGLDRFDRGDGLDGLDGSERLEGLDRLDGEVTDR